MPASSRDADDALLANARLRSFGQTNSGMHHAITEAMRRHNMDVDSVSNLPLSERLNSFVNVLDKDHRVTKRPRWWADAAAVIASLIMLTGIIPAALVITQNESACDVSWLFLFAYLLAQCLWMVYAFAYRLPINFIGALVAASLVIWMVVLKQKYDGWGSAICDVRRSRAEGACEQP